MKAKVDKSGWKIKKGNKNFAETGVSKMREALAQDEREYKARGLGLPSDWRNRVFC